MRKHIAEMELPMYASFSLSFALMGDAFLYWGKLKKGRNTVTTFVWNFGIPCIQYIQFSGVTKL
jgi:hypothetical protein